MKKQTYTVIGIIVVLALTIAFGVLTRSPHARAQTPESWNEEPLVPAARQQQTDNPNEQAPTLVAGEEAQAEAALSAGGASYIVLPPAAFTSDGFDPDGFFMSFMGGYFYGTVSSGACLLAPVHLPRGVTVVSLEVFAADGNPSGSEWFDLYRIPLASGSPQTMASVSTPTGSSAGRGPYVDTTIAYAEVSDDYAYQLTTCARTQISVYGARIGYVATTFLPAVMQEDGP